MRSGALLAAIFGWPTHGDRAAPASYLGAVNTAGHDGCSVGHGKVGAGGDGGPRGPGATPDSDGQPGGTGQLGSQVRRTM